MRQTEAGVVVTWSQHCIRCAVLLALLAVASVQAAGPAEQLVQPLEVRKLYADGKHNAFTALVTFQDRFWLAFRSATAHNSADGEIVLLESADAQSWREAVRGHTCPAIASTPFAA